MSYNLFLASSKSMSVTELDERNLNIFCYILLSSSKGAYFRGTDEEKRLNQNLCSLGLEGTLGLRESQFESC